jgi:hypothetical protein
VRGSRIAARRVSLALLALGVSVLSLVAPSRSGSADPACRSDASGGIHDPGRLQLQSACVVLTGTVTAELSGPNDIDGDWTFDITPDSSLQSTYGSRVHVEIVPQDQATVGAAPLGSHVRVVGPWVLDLENGTQSEIHPAWSVSMCDARGCHVVGPPHPPGLWMVSSTGGVFGFGSAAPIGGPGLHLNQPIVGVGPTRTGTGYWLVASDGGIFSYGDARFLGSTGSIRLNQPIVGVGPTRGAGYWLVASDGGIFSYGDARFLGSTGSIRLNQPIVGMAPTATGAGYWLVASDGGIFSFGDARFLGSTGSIRLNQPIVGIAPTATGAGYWLVASDGGIFSFGDATFEGSLGSRASSRVAAMVPNVTGKGYWLVTARGELFPFGDAVLSGNAASAAPIVGSARLP